MITAREPLVAADAIGEYLRAAAVAVLVVALIADTAGLRQVIWGLIASALALAAVNVFQYATGSFDQAYLGFAEARVVQVAGAVDAPRLTGPIGDPNFFAQLMVVAVPLAVDRAVREARLALRLVAGLAAASSAATVVLTYSRGGLLALVVVATLLIAAHRSRAVVMTAAIGLATLVSLTATLQGAYLARLASVAQVQGVVTGQPPDPSLQGRASEAYVALEMFRDHPLLGIGFGGYPAQYQRYAQELGSDPRIEARESHSLFLEVAAESGLVGLTVIGLFLVVGARSALRARSALLAAGDRDTAGLVEGVLIATAGYLTAAIFLHPYLLRVQLVLLALVIAAGVLGDRRFRRVDA